MANHLIPISEKLKRYVENDNGCWEWSSTRDRDGYGVFGHGRGKQLRAHRASYEFHKGPVSDGLFVCHRCDNPSCINPDHLFIGSPKENTGDMVRKGRKKLLVGEDHRNSKLTKSDVIEIRASRVNGETLLNTEDLESILETQGDEIALLLIGGVNYYTGQYLDLKKITEIGHQQGCKVGIDLAHGVGNIQPNLHDSGVDFAAWCTYKYMNSGPGSLGGIFVHERYAHDTTLKRFAGWWSQNKTTRFDMRQPLDITPGAEGWQLSNPPILSMAAIKASLELFKEVGMAALRKKSIQLTGYLEYLILELQNENISIITPKDPKQRGCQLSIQVKNANKSLHTKLTAAHVITDWRTPDVIRCAPTPFYNSFEDVYKMVEILKTILNG